LGGWEFGASDFRSPIEVEDRFWNSDFGFTITIHDAGSRVD